MPRYRAMRTLTRRWLHHDLPLREVSYAKTLSGPQTITATVPQDLMSSMADDGMPLFDEWATTIIREDDNGYFSHAAIMQPQTQFEAQTGVINCVGPTGYFKGWLYDKATTWGTQVDPIKVVYDLVKYVQAQQDSNPGSITIVGATNSRTRIGDNEEPYRLQFWEQPDVGEEIDKLAQLTPFDYEERVEGSHAAGVKHVMHIGQPRIGTTRTDIAFEQGVNMRAPVPLTGREEYCNDVLGIGNGEGSTMVWSRATKRDGRLRRTRVITDKTATKAYMDKRVQTFLENNRGAVDIAQITVDDTAHARLSTLAIGDDIRVRGWLPAFVGTDRAKPGEFDVKLRILSINGADNAQDQAVLNTALSSNFSYIATEEIT